MRKRLAVAFLQNMWVKDPDALRASIARRGEEMRLRAIEYGLFAGCLTGRRIKAAFGEKLIRTILWEEASREIAGDAKTVCPPDPEHIRKVLAEHQPTVVLTFGRVATDAVSGLWQGAVIAFPHPACRNSQTTQLLRDGARLYAKMMGETI